MAVQRKMANLIASIPESNRWKVDKEIDFENTDVRGRIIPQHLGRIASDMTDWEGTIADNLGLTRADRADIIERYPRKPSLQRREALSIWKSGLGSAATYRALMEVFIRAGRMRCAESVAEILREGAVPTQPGTTAATPAAPVPLGSGGSGAVTTGGSGHLPESAAASAGKVDYAEFVCDLLKDDTGDHGVPGSTTPTTVSHAQSASATTTTTAAQIDFSESLGPNDLARWLRQEYGADYADDVEKLCKAKFNGKRLLNNISTLNNKYKLDISPGFLEEIEERAGQLKGPATAGVTPPPGGNGAASLPPSQHTPSSSTQTQHNAATLSHQSLIEQLGIHAPKWKEIGTYLGFHQPELRLIETSPALLMGAPGTWFSAMLEAWLQWEPGDKRGSKERASLESLKTAVDRAGLGRTAAELHY